jgi:hypothetical protein
MNQYEGEKTFRIVNGLFHIAFILILSLLTYSLPAPVFGSTDIPVKVNTTPVALGAAALFTGFGTGAVMNDQAIFTVANRDAASPLDTGFHTTEKSNSGAVNGSIQTAPPCEEICILSNVDRL